jgi:hypothetical protein
MIAATSKPTYVCAREIYIHLIQYMCCGLLLSPPVCQPATLRLPFASKEPKGDENVAVCTGSAAACCPSSNAATSRPLLSRKGETHNTRQDLEADVMVSTDFGEKDMPPHVAAAYTVCVSSSWQVKLYICLREPPSQSLGAGAKNQLLRELWPTRASMGRRQCEG